MVLGRRKKRCSGPSKGKRHDRLRILQLCVRFPPAPGGVETHVLQISKILKQIGHHVTIYTSDLYKEQPFTRIKSRSMKSRTEEVMGLKVQRFKAYTLGSEMHYVFTPAMLPAILRSDFDLIHAHSYGYFHVNLAAFARKLTDIPFIFTTHFHPEWSMWGGEKRRSLRKVYDKLLGKSTLDVADRIIVHTKNELGLMARTGVKKGKVNVIPAGVDISSFTPPPDGRTFRKAIGIDDPFVLYAGRLATNKGLDHLVSAFADVSTRKGMKDLKLVLVGEDHGVRNGLEKIAKKRGIKDRVMFTGHVSDDDVFRSAFSACELLALPSDYEAFGLVLVEAMACGKPCVATRVGGVPEVIDEGKTGLLVEFGDVKALSKSMLTVLSDREKAKAMGAAGRKRVEKRFTWRKVTEQLEVVYKEVAARG